MNINQDQMGRVQELFSAFLKELKEKANTNDLTFLDIINKSYDHMIKLETPEERKTFLGNVLGRL